MNDLKGHLLNKISLENMSPEDLEREKTEFRKKQKKKYQKDFRKAMKRFELVMKISVFTYLRKTALRYGMKTGPFIIKAAYAYLQQAFIFPDPEEIRELRLGIRRIGNNINQLTRYCHGHQAIHLDALHDMQVQLNALESFINQRLDHPDMLVDAVDKELVANPAFAQALENCLMKYRQDYRQ